MGSSRGANGGPQAMEQAWKHALRIFSIDVRFALNISANSMDELAFNFSQKRQKLTFPYISSLPKKYPGQGGYVAGLRTLSNHFEVNAYRSYTGMSEQCAVNRLRDRPFHKLPHYLGLHRGTRLDSR